MHSTEIDSVSPTLRPDEGAVLTQRWADLLFVHWAVDAAALRARLPAGLELDTFEGRAYVGIVPFTLYTESEGTLYRARVHHEPYPAQPAVVPSLREELLPSIGLARPERPPLAHYAREVHVDVFPLREV